MKIDIVIKSFNRPYYLDRCIKSIYLNVLGDFQIKVLDDGTPEIFLSAIRDRFPDVIIESSPLAKEKSESIKKYLSGGQVSVKKQIPGGFWLHHIEQSSEIFFLIEDDIWISKPINLKDICDNMLKDNLAMVKTGWLGNDRLISGHIKQLSEAVEEVIPSISLATQIIVLNKFWVRTIIHKTGLLDKSNFDFDYQLPLYSLYTVASAFFAKDYWLYLWSDKQENVNEFIQLKKAWQWYKGKGGRYGKTRHESTKTSFITSATNSFSNTNFDIFHFNSVINEAWLEGSFDSMENFPNDFSEAYVCSCLELAANPQATFEGWKVWASKFKHQYISFGCQVD